MSQPILIKRSAVQGKVPAVADLQLSELGINTYDGKLFLRKNNGADSIVEVGAHTFTGDATGSGNGSIALTLANSGVTAGQFGSSTLVPVVTVDAKGRITSISTQAVASAAQAGSLANARTISATGDGTWSVSFDGSANVTSSLTLAASGVTAGQYTKLTVNAKGLVTSGTALASSDVTTALGFTPVNTANLGVANGVATLDATGRLPASQLTAAVVGAVVYQGVWNASTNSPALTSSVGTKGQYYKVSVAGSTSIDGHASWLIGDTIIFNGSTWDKLDGLDSQVSSVFGRVGAVVMTTADVTTALGFTPYNATNPAGYISGNQAITHTGDVTGTGTTNIAMTLANSGVAAGGYGSSTAIPYFVVDAKGRITSAGTQIIAPVFSNITGLPTTVAGYGITDAQAKSTDLTAIAALVGTTGFLKKTGTGAWALDTNTYLTGNQTVTVTGDATGSGTTAITLTLANSGATAGTYNNVTVNAKGLVTASSNVAYLTGNQTVTATGDVTGSGTTALPLTLADSGVTAGTYTKLTVNAKGLVTVGAALASSDVTTALGFTPANAANQGAANGIATLDGTGRLPISQLTAAVVGAVVYQGVWNASTNSPALVSGTGTKGNYYKVSVAGSTSIDGHAQWNLGDTIIFNGATWDKLDGLDSQVSSVFGRVGAVTLLSADVTTALGFTPYNATNPAGYISGNQNITATGDVTGSGTTALPLTLSSTGVVAGTYNNVTVDVKGRVSSGSNVAYLTANQTVTVSGDATGSGTTAIALTLANSGVVAGTYTKITVDAKGRATVGASLASADVTTALGFTPANKAGDTFTGLVTATNFAKSVSVGLTAAGTTQGTGLALTSAINVISTAAASSGVVLPAAVAGVLVTVVNVGANAIDIYPASGAQIDSLAANAAFSLGVASKLEFVAVSATQWYAMTGVYA
jgi:phage-related tail fiber protein